MDGFSLSDKIDFDKEFDGNPRIIAILYKKCDCSRRYEPYRESSSSGKYFYCFKKPSDPPIKVWDIITTLMDSKDSLILDCPRHCRIIDFKQPSQGQVELVLDDPDI